LISVIIPTARRSQLLPRAIKSALAQSVNDIEVVVIVDGPDPETSQYLTQVTDPRFRYIQNVRSLGSAEARNVGVKASRGEWIAFLDDDDEWREDKLEMQLAAAGNVDDCVIVSCLSEVVTPLQRYVWPRRVYDNLSPLAEYLFDRRSWFRGDTMLQCSSLLMPRWLFLDLMFTPIHDDWDFLLRAVNTRGAKIRTVDKPLVKHYIEDDRQSLGASFDWKRSLAWAETNRAMINPHAYAGFCLTVIAPQAVKAGDHTAFVSLLYRALRYGRPRLVHIALYLAIWLIPMEHRQRIRSVWQGSRQSQSA